MSTSQSDLSKGQVKPPAKRTRAARTPSASEIARNIRHFETWSSYQGCEQVSYLDIPKDIQKDVANVFSVKGILPLASITKDSAQYKVLSQCCPQGWFHFLEKAREECPDLFYDEASKKTKSSEADALRDLLPELVGLYNIWRKLTSMQKSQAKYSEADYAANVYNPIRSQAVSSSHGRSQCGMCLPQPLDRSRIDTESRRVLNAKIIIPDFSIFVANRGSIQSLSLGTTSPYHILSRDPTIKKCGKASQGGSFRFQATPCAQVPKTPRFEFASSVFEDKKPTQSMLDDAYRQNRMATAAAARHLHSLHIRAPVIGLVWADGSVRAHVDWCQEDEGKQLNVFSAPYPCSTGEVDMEDLSISVDLFHEWELHRPSQILQVYFIVKNIDNWTNGLFRQRVIDGVNSFTKPVVNRSTYKPWRRVGELSVLATKGARENTSISISTVSSSPPRKVKGRRRLGAKA